MNEVLIQAAEYIDQHGWTQGELADSQGRVCLYGALSEVTNWNSSRKCVEFSAYMTARDHLHKFVEEIRGIKLTINLDSVVYLNDTVLTSGEEASKVLREAAEWVPNA